MTEYTTDPEAIAHYLAARSRTAVWVDSITGKTLVAPSAAPSLVSDTDDGMSSQDSDAESSHSLPPRMLLRYPDGRPDVSVSASWRSESQKPSSTSLTYSQHHASRPQPGSHGHHPSNPDMHSRVPSNAVPLYVTPPPPIVATHPETIHVRPSPTGQQSPPNAYFPPDPQNDPSSRPRSKSIRSSKRPQVSLQMIYSPPPPRSSQSHSVPVSPTGEGFQPAQPPPPLPQPGSIIAPSPVYGFPSVNSPPESPQAVPPTGSSKTHSRTHSYTHPAAQQSSNPGPPPTLYHSGSTAQRPRRHSSRAGSSSHLDPHPSSQLDSQQSSSHTGSGISPSRRHGHGPPSIIYAPSANSSLNAFNPPVITTRPPANMPIHAPTPHHAHVHRMTQSISDPTPIGAGGSLGRNGTRGRLFEDFSRTPSPNTARARAKESAKKDKSRKDKWRRKRRDGAGGADNDDYDDGASFSSGSTYYVLPSPGQKIRVVVSVLLYCFALIGCRPDLSKCYFPFPTQHPPSMKGLYAEPTSASKSTPVLRSHRSPNGPYLPPPPVPPQPSRPQKRPLLQRILHPQFGFNSNANATYTSPSSRRTFRH